MDREELKENTLRILKEITKHIESGNYEKVSNYLAYSSSGDGYGQDNYFIDFGIDYEMDISEVVELLNNK